MPGRHSGHRSTEHDDPVPTPSHQSLRVQGSEVVDNRLLKGKNLKLATLRLKDGNTAAARVEGGEYVEIPGLADVGALLGLEDWREIARAADGSRHPGAGVSLETLVPSPSKVICVGLNYAAHIEEMGRDLPVHPTLFAKFTDTLTGPYDELESVNEDSQMDWEGELAIVVGS